MEKNKKRKVYSCALLTGVLIAGKSFQFSVDAIKYNSLKTNRCVDVYAEIKATAYATAYAERIAAGNNHQRAINYTIAFIERRAVGDSDQRATIFANIYAERRAVGDGYQLSADYALNIING